MLYKTITLALIQEHPEIHEQLRANRTLVAILDRYARALKASHEAWKDRLAQAKPGSDPGQIASEATELALRELNDRLCSASTASDAEALSLDAAMAFQPTPPE